jgi:hypothetical protein
MKIELRINGRVSIELKPENEHERLAVQAFRLAWEKHSEKPAVGKVEADGVAFSVEMRSNA